MISGMSELHLDVIQHRLKNRYKLDINTHMPHVPYLETILRRRRGATTGTRSRPAAAASSPTSTCGSGPASAARASTSSTRSRGASIPNQFIPAVEKGVREQMEKGVISGNPVVDVEVEVFFGKDHPVDSSEQAFKTAAATAFRKAF